MASITHKTNKRVKPDVFTDVQQRALDEIKAFKTGKLRFRTTLLDKSGYRDVIMETGPEQALRSQCAEVFSKLRKATGLSQSELAKAIDASTRSVQGWEYGKPCPGPVLKLLRVMGKIPAAKKLVLAEVIV